MDKIKVSVIIPVYNAEETLQRCVSSVQSQTLKEIEIICVDDGSSDSSAKLLNTLSHKDRRIIVLRQENQYAGVARNKGISIARGSYITFMDSDDIYCSANVLQKLYNKARAKNADMIKGRFRYIDYQTQEVSEDNFSQNSSIGPVLRRNLNFSRYPLRFVHTADVPWNGLYRRKFLLENDIKFNNLMCVNDHSFYIHCLLKSEKILFTRTQTVLYTINRAGSLVANKPIYFTSQLQSYNIVENLCHDEPLSIRRAVMRQELIGVFSLYRKMDSILQEKFRTQFADFLCGIDENVVGKDFLNYFEWAEQYSMLRHGICVNPIRRPAVRKFLDCMQEHGVSYTCRLLIKKLKF